MLEVLAEEQSLAGGDCIKGNALFGCVRVDESLTTLDGDGNLLVGNAKDKGELFDKV